MSEEVKKEETQATPPLPPRRIVAEALGVYRIIDGNKVFSFEFPAQYMLEDNLAAVSFLKEEIMKVINDKIAKERALEEVKQAQDEVKDAEVKN